MVAINTDYKNDTPTIEEIEWHLKNIADAGFSHVHWGYDWRGEYIYADIEMVQIKKMLDCCNLKMKGIHATEGGMHCSSTGNKRVLGKRYNNRKDYTSLNEYSRLAGVELIKNRVDLAYVVGSKEIVLHMELPYIELSKNEDYKKKYWQQVFKSLDELEIYCKARNVKIAFENLLAPLQDQIDQLDRLFANYDSDFLGFCFDSGHATLVSPDEHFIFAERYKNRIIAIHLQDTDGITQELMDDHAALFKLDKHAIPFTGVVNWNKLAEIIAQSPYELPVTLEVIFKTDTYEEEMLHLKEAFVKAEKINEMVKRYRVNGVVR